MHPSISHLIASGSTAMHRGRFVPSRSLVISVFLGGSLACGASEHSEVDDAEVSRGRAVAVDLNGHPRSSDAPPDRLRPLSGPAKNFWDAFNGDRYGDLPAVLQGLESELAKPASSDPAGNNEWLPLTAGLAYLWESAEAGQNPAFTPERAQANVNRALALLGEASARHPSDRRTDSFTGAVNVNLGRALLAVPVPEVQARGNALVALGNETLTKAHIAWPEFHGFTYAFVRASSPTATADSLDEAVKAVVTSMQYCFGPHVGYDEAASKIRLDVRPSIRLGADASGFRRVCGNSWMVPHSTEGFFLIMGDVLVRRGRPRDLSAARELYRNAKAASSFATWGFKPMLEQRMKQVEARAAAHRDAESANDPFLGPRVSQCVVCHADGARERRDD